MLKIALDGMGGDCAPSIVLDGAEFFLSQRAQKKSPNREASIQFIIFGLPEIESMISDRKFLSSSCTFVASQQVITSDMPPLKALRYGRGSSLGMAITAVAQDQAHAVISAGNTGAYMALSKILLKTLDGIDRPAIPAVIPTLKDRSVILDLGANLECTIQNLVQFAILGSVYAQELLNLPHPTVGLLNIGSESIKGDPKLRETAEILKECPFVNFQGFVEGDDIAKGTTDVIVTDGFSGNIVLKAIEGTARLITHFIKEELMSSWCGKLGAWISQPNFRRFREKSHPRNYNGAVFLGLKKNAVKSHGSVDAIGFANAIRVACDMVHHHLPEAIQIQLDQYLSCSDPF
jgi:glycerol-3-phosphate acyltransferase PlsX